MKASSGFYILRRSLKLSFEASKVGTKSSASILMPLLKELEDSPSIELSLSDEVELSLSSDSIVSSSTVIFTISSYMLKSAVLFVFLSSRSISMEYILMSSSVAVLLKENL